MKRLTHAAAVAALVMPAVALAQPVSSGPSYNFLEGGYVGVEDAHGFGIGANLALGEMFHVEFGFTHVGEGNTDVSATTLGFGVNYPISGTTDWVASAGLARGTIDVGNFDVTETGFVLQTGLRSMVTPDTEVNGFVTYVDTFTGETSIGVGIARYFNDRVAVTGSLAANDGDFAYGVGLRVRF